VTTTRNSNPFFVSGGAPKSRTSSRRKKNFALRAARPFVYCPSKYHLMCSLVSSSTELNCENYEQNKPRSEEMCSGEEMMVDSRNLSRARSDTMAANDGDDNSTRGTVQQQPTPYYPRLAQEMLSKNQKSKHPVSRKPSTVTSIHSIVRDGSSSERTECLRRTIGLATAA
jgi:hypothetical protein